MTLDVAYRTTMGDPELLFLKPSTSAHGRGRGRATATLLLITVGLGVASTSSADGLPVSADQRISGENTSAGRPVPRRVARDHAAEVSLVRRISGFTWDELAGLFGVSRRTMHLWASGARLNDDHARRLEGVADAFRLVQDRDPVRVRAALKASGADGVSPLQMLESGRYADAGKLLSSSSGPVMARAPKPSPDALAARQPPPPDQLVGALQDRPYKTRGRLLATKPIGSKRA